jgi:hypothetical protein
MKYRCDICGSTGHPTEEHVQNIEGEITKKEKAPLADALNTLTQLDRTPSKQEVIDIVDEPVEVWLKKSKDTWLKRTIEDEARAHKATGLDNVYSQAILKSMYASLEQQDVEQFRGQTSEQILKRVNQRPEHEYYGYKRIWAKNLSNSEAETIYVNAAKDACNLLAELEAIDLNNIVIDNRLLKLLYWRENLDGIEKIFLDWGDINETDLNEFHHGDENLKETLAKIDALGKQIMQRVDRSQKFPEDERLYRINLNDAWHEVQDDWWTRPGVWQMEELQKKINKKD